MLGTDPTEMQKITARGLQLQYSRASVLYLLDVSPVQHMNPMAEVPTRYVVKISRVLQMTLSYDSAVFKQSCI